MKAAINVGTDAKTVIEVRDALLAIMAAPNVDQLTIQKAFEAFTASVAVKDVMITNCHFVGTEMVSENETS